MNIECRPISSEIAKAVTQIVNSRRNNSDNRPPRPFTDEEIDKELKAAASKAKDCIDSDVEAGKMILRGLSEPIGSPAYVMAKSFVESFMR